MDILAVIAERKIQEAIERGELDSLPNAGKPLTCDDDAGIPQDLRMAYRILKNAGCVPPEIDLLRQIASLRELIECLDDDRERMRRVRELNFKLLAFNERRKRPLVPERCPDYEMKLFDRLL
ncbi:MAG: DnaJ family domain-containing protein [Thermodesulfovibrionales bacterium]